MKCKKRQDGTVLTIFRQMCNRGQPCEGCSRRGQAASCRYAPNAIRNKPRPPKVANIQERLENLEQMLASIAPDSAAAGVGAGKQSVPGSSTVSASYQHYHVSVSNSRQEDQVLPPEVPHRHESGDGQVSYLHSSHWMAIMDEIKEVREHIAMFDRPALQEEPERKSFVPEDVAGYLFGQFPVVDIEEVISSLPTRSTCDVLVSQYFNSKFMVLGTCVQHFDD